MCHKDLPLYSNRYLLYILYYMYTHSTVYTSTVFLSSVRCQLDVCDCVCIDYEVLYKHLYANNVSSYPQVIQDDKTPL